MAILGPISYYLVVLVSRVVLVPRKRIELRIIGKRVPLVGIYPPHPEDITIYGMSYDCPDIQTRLLLHEGSLRTEKQWLEDIYIAPVFS